MLLSEAQVQEMETRYASPIQIYNRRNEPIVQQMLDDLAVLLADHRAMRRVLIRFTRWYQTMTDESPEIFRCKWCERRGRKDGIRHANDCPILDVLDALAALEPSEAG